MPVLGQKAPIPGLKGTILGPEGPIPGLKGLIPGLRRPISGLERTTLGLRFYARPARPISGLRRAFASLRRSKLGLRSNLVHFYLRRVYTDLSELISDLRIVLPHLLAFWYEKGLFMPEGLNSYNSPILVTQGTFQI